MKMKKLSRAAAVCALAIAGHAAAQSSGQVDRDDNKNPAAQLETPTTEVVATTPLPGIGTPLSQVPANVQVVTSETLDRQQATELGEFLERNLGSVSLNFGSANSFQPDLNFRGFQGSSLLGVPQGISAFVDGVRVNESFGDTINWDLIPTPAISSMQLIPGSNPVFGLNTLGGALSINTKSGKTYPGLGLTVQGGSWGRKQTTVEVGSSKDNWDFYLMGNYLDENGWRQHSSSRIQQLFGKVGYETGDFDADLSYSFADNELQGTQATPLTLLDFDPRQAYTYPDITRNRMNFLNLRMSKVLAADKILGGNVYYRSLTSTNTGSNVNGDYDGSGNPVCDGTTINPCPASNDKSVIDTNSLGAALQYTQLGRLFSRENKFTLGVSYDQGNTNFTRFEQLAVFTSDRNTVADPANPDFVQDTNVDTVTRYYGAFFTDTFSFNELTHLTLSGRWNRAKVTLTDRSGQDPGLNGDHAFTRFNPAVGLNFNPSRALNTYATYNEGMRAPSAVELTCADPAAPCKLPNAFLADPPLNPVISKTFEIGSRGLLGAATQYSIALFRTDLQDDIQFIANSASGTSGYFANVPKTRRQGLELGLQQQLGKLTLRGAYSYIDATYQSTFNMASPNNSFADPTTGQITVTPGDKIPGIPAHNFKLRADYAFTPMLFAGLSLVYASSQYARGDENNLDVNGKLPTYLLVNLDGTWRITDQLRIFGRVNNVFDKSYQTVGVLGENFFRGPGFTYDATLAGPEQFRTPGTPRAIYIGLRYDFIPAKTAVSPGDDR
jgi:outer membrane receptor protein involved in Fe transport